MLETWRKHETSTKAGKVSECTFVGKVNLVKNLTFPTAFSLWESTHQIIALIGEIE